LSEKVHRSKTSGRFKGISASRKKKQLKREGGGENGEGKRGKGKIGPKEVAPGEEMVAA